jgi:type IV pilus assembly protein PilY1
MPLAWLGAGLLALPALAPAQIAQTPLYLGDTAPPLTMIVMGRDHTLYYAAYNDTTDLTGDGVPDVGYKPGRIDYLGLFDSYKCYRYTGTGASAHFEPVAQTANKRCDGSTWSGDFLNYLTTSRIDALRVVLYGGTRDVDAENSTILARAYIPQDAHSWGKEYTSIAVDGYDIAHYTPYGQPTQGNRHLFASTSLTSAKDRPRLRVLTNVPYRVWEWVAIEQPVAGNRVLHGTQGPIVSPVNFNVRVAVCVEGMLEPNCRRYANGFSKPTGLLHDFGEDERMWFGLLTGSYEKNISGGVLRRNIGSLRPEINPTTGQFTNVDGVIRNIDRLAFVGFDSGNTNSYVHNANCGWIANRPITEGECRMWGNPVAEMMYEAVRYFAGRTTPTEPFTIAGSGNDDAALNLSRPAWTDPYASAPYCAVPVQLVISDINPSYDTQYLPGTAFGTFSGDNLSASGRPALNVSALANEIWDLEFGAPGSHYIGETLTVNDGAPTPKNVTSFNIRGLAPEEPTKLGGYYSASVARYGLVNDLRPDLDGDQNMRTFVVALASNLPRIRFPLGNGTVSLIPYAKSPWSRFGGNVDPVKGTFQPTNTIVSVFVQELANIPPMVIDDTINGGRPYAVFRINFEDVEQGADHDMDAIVRYELRAEANGSLTVSLRSEYAAGSIEQHMGYVISGTTRDGLYLEVRDCDTANPNGTDPSRHPAVPAAQCQGTHNGPHGTGASMRRGSDYYLGTPNWGGVRVDGVALNPALAPTLPGECDQPPASRPAQCAWGLPLSSTRTFVASGNPSATLLESPLWYAAKYGAAADPAVDPWDTTGDGNPDNYFLVTNPARLREQMQQAFNAIIGTVGSSSSLATNSTRLDSETRVYQARFDSERWSGELLARPVNPDGTLGAPLWDAGQRIIPPATVENRLVLTMTGATRQGPGIPFRWNQLTAAQRSALDIGPEGVDGLGEARLDYLRGARTDERQNGGPFRERASILGDIVNSNPWFVHRQNFGYERLPGTEGSSYQAWRAALTRPPMIYVGANDGMLHGFEASEGSNGGTERIAYIPHTVLPRLNRLTFPNYAHEYFVDGSPVAGDAWDGSNWRTILVSSAGAGGRAVFALDVTDPTQFSTSSVRWEINNQTPGFQHLGYVLGRPSIVRLRTGAWAAIFGNGYGSGRPPRLYVVDLFTGALIREITTRRIQGGNEVAGWPTDNGLSSPFPVDEDGDGIVDFVYAGDLYGNLWKFDLTSNQSNNWNVAFRQGNVPLPLFTACHNQSITGTTDNAPHSCPADRRQPITMRPQVGLVPGGGLQVYFGTGKYFEVGDNFIGSGPVQSYYGITDLDERVNRGQLLRQQILAEVPVGDSGRMARALSNNQPDADHRGWYLDLLSPSGYNGERAIAEPELRHDQRIIFTTIIPSNDPCRGGGTGWIMEFNRVTGGRFDRSVLDLDEDGRIDDGDFIEVEIDGEIIRIPASGVSVPEDHGLPSRPTIISAGEIEYKLVPGTSGDVDTIIELGDEAAGRQSWRQIFP